METIQKNPPRRHAGPRGTLALWVKVMVFFLILPTIARADEDPHATGLRPPTPNEALWDRAHMIIPQRIKLNSRALSRINEHRDAIGQERLLMGTQDMAPIGQEIEGTTIEAAPQLTNALPQIIAPTAFPPAVDNSTLKYFPPIRSQGSIGSCAQWTGIYYCFTHMNAMVRDLDAKNGPESNRFSPKFTYNLVNGGTDTGSWPTSGWAIAANHGAANLADWPYNGDYKGWPLTASIWRNALNTRVDSTGYLFNCDTPAGMDQLKTLLINGYVVSFATYINSWRFKNISDDPSTSDDDAFVGKAAGYWINGTSGAHGMTVVGYNDSIWVDINSNGTVDTGEKGAFRIANSWGTGWKDGGFTWLAYDALKSVSEVSGGPSTNRGPAWWGSYVMWVTAKPEFTPKALAEFTLNHAQRNQLRVFLGLSDTNQTTPTSFFFPSYVLQNAGGTYAFNGGSTAVDATFVMDFSDIASEYDLNKRWYMRVQDSTAGSAALVKSFKWLNGADNTEVANTTLPSTVDASVAEYYLDATMTHGSGNTPPTISAVANMSTSEDTPTGPIALILGDAETASTALTLAGVSSNATLLPNSQIVFSGTGANRTMVLTPAANQTGTTTITLTVTDEGGLIVQTAFTLTVNPVNDAPVAQNQTVGVLFNTPKTLTLGATDVEGDALTYTPSSPSHGALSGTPPHMTYTPTTGYTGTDAFTFTASDGLLTSPPATVTVLIDTTPPTVALSQPTAGQTLSGTYRLRANASDNVSVDRVLFFVDGVSKSTDAVASYTYDWNTLETSNGGHSLYARAYDIAGNQTNSAIVNVTVSNTGTAAVSVQPSSLSFHFIQGSTIPPVGILSIGSVAGAPTLGWTVSVGSSWMSASPSSGEGEDLVSVGVDPEGLAPGIYISTTTITPLSSGAQAGTPVPVQVTVSLTVTEASDTFPPTVPGGLLAVPNGSGGMLLSWEGSTDSGGSGLAEYRLYRDSVLIAQPTETHYTDTGLTVGSYYDYAVSAADNAANESSWSNIVHVLMSNEGTPAGLIEAYGYPEPAVRGAAPKIRAVLGHVDYVELTIYDRGGTPRHSARLDSPNAIVNGEPAYDYTWIDDIPSGIYYVVIQGRTGSQTVKARTRLTVVR